MPFDGNLNHVPAETHSEPTYPPTPGTADSLARFYELPSDHTLQDLARAWHNNPQPRLLGPNEDGNAVDQWAENTLKRNVANDN